MLNSAAPIAKSRMDKRRVDFNTLMNTPTKRIQIADELSPQKTVGHKRF